MSSATGVSNADAACESLRAKSLQRPASNIRASRWMIDSDHCLIHVADTIGRIHVTCSQVSYCGAERIDRFFAVRTSQGPSAYCW